MGIATAGSYGKGLSFLKWALFACALVIAVGVAYSIAPSEAEAQTSNAGGSSAGGSNVPPTNTAPPPPIARNDRFIVAEDKALRIPARGVLRNDRGVGLRAFKVTNPRNGRLTLRQNGSLVYVPRANFNGRDSFVYRARDNRGRVNRGVVTIIVRPVNDAPVARGNSYKVGEDGTLNVAAPGVLRNDSDVDRNRLFAAKVSGPRNGDLTLRPNGSFTYEPDRDHNGNDSFTYRASDGKGGSDTATVDINVNSVNDAPTFDLPQNENQTAGEDTGSHEVSGFVENVSPGPPDEAGQNVTVTLSNDNGELFAQNGRPDVDPSGKLTYTLAPDAFGEATVTVNAEDDGPGSPPNENTTEKTFTITALPINDAPSFTKGANQTADEDAGPQTVSGWATDISEGPANESGQTVGFVVSNNNDGLFTQNGQPTVGSDGTLTYTSTENASGEATVTVKIKDGGGTERGGVEESAEQTFTIAIEAVNDAPKVTAPETTEVTEDVASELTGISVSDVDAESGDITLTLSVASGTLAATSGGRVTVNGSGTDELVLTGTLADINAFIAASNVSFTTANNATADVELTATASDGGNSGKGGAKTDETKSTLTVIPVNDPPTVSFDSPPTDANEGDTKTFAFTVTDPDEGDSFTVKSGFPDCGTGGTQIGQTVKTAAGGSFECRFPDGDASPEVRIQVADSENVESDVASAPVDVANVDPVVTAAENQGSDEGENKSFNLGSFTDPGDDGPWEVTVDWGDNSTPDTFNATSPGSLGQLSHEYADDQATPYEVMVTVTEAGANTPPFGSDTFDVTVGNVAPTANSQSVETNEDDPGELVTLSGSDPGNDPLTFEITSLPTKGTLYEGDGTTDEIMAVGGISGDEVTYVPDTAYNGSDSFDFEACDDGSPALCDGATASLEVLAVNDKPDFTSQGNQTTNEDAGPQTVTGWVTNFNPGAANESDEVDDYLITDANGTPVDSDLFTANGQPDVSDTGTLTYTPAENANGSITVKVSVRDDGGTERGGVDTSDARDLTITINSVNDAPDFTAAGNQTVDEDSNGPNDPANSRQHTVTGWITNFDPGPDNESTQQVDDYIVTDANGDDLFTSGGQPDVANNGTLTYTLAENAFGTATFEAAVRDDGGTANGGVDTSATQTFTITVDPVNDAPTIDLDGAASGTGSTAEFLEALGTNGGDPAIISPAAEVADVDDEDIESATVTLTNRPDDPSVGDANESLDADVSVNGITGIAKNYDSSSGVLSLSGSASKADYQQVLRTVAYDNTAAPPDSEDRTIEVTVNDGVLNSNIAIATVTVTPLNEAPVVDLNGAGGTGIDSSASFTEGAASTMLASDATVTDVDDTNMESAEITLTNPLDENAESLSVDVNGTSITASTYDSTSGVLSLSGTDTSENYRDVLRTVKYENTSQNPDTTNRAVTFTVNDGQDDSTVATSTVSLTAINDAPKNTLPAGPFATGVDENLVINGISVEDVDAGDNDIRTTFTVDGGTVALDANAAGGAAVSGNETGSVTLDGTVAEINATLADGVTYNSATGGSFTLTMTTDDLGNSPNPPETDIDEVAIIVDAAPEVVSTTPMGGAETFSPGGDIVVNFSESVDVSNAAFSLKCPASETNSRSFTLSGSGTDEITINPSADLPGATLCEVTVAANNVSDTDTFDPPDNMAADHTFTFETAARAMDDTYQQTVTGNVGINSASIPYSVTTNDEIKAATNITFTGWNENSGQTENGGTVSMTTFGADRGKFMYNPPAGFEGNDRFTYTLTGGSSATVTVPVSGMIWFVNNNSGACASNCDGRLSNPFTSLSAFNAINNGGNNPNLPAANDNPAAGDNIFVHESAAPYTGGVTLLDNQRLIGQDASQSLAAITTLSQPSGSVNYPTMSQANTNKTTITNASGNGVTLGQSDTIRGLTVGNTSGSGIKGTSVNAASMGSDVAVSGTNGGAAVDISGGGGTIGYGGTISNSSGGAVSVANRTGGTTTFSGDINSTGGGVNVQNNSGSTTVNFSGANKVLNTGANNAVSLASNTGATINFTNGGLDIDTTSGTGFSALGGGTLTVQTGTNANNINSTGAKALDFSGIAIGSNGASFAGISSSGSATDGIRLDNVSGTFTASGGSIQNATDQAVDITGNNSGDTVNFTYDGTITDDLGTLVNVSGQNGGTKDFNGRITDGDDGDGAGVSLANNSGATVRFDGGLTLSTGGNAAFSATGSGTVTVTDPAGATNNTIATTTGTAMNVANTTIASDNLTFEKISANGAPNGIVLDGTGTSGGLTVTGTGTTAGSGGTIRNTVGADGATAGIGVSLNNTRNVSLSNMQINDHQNFAIRGNNVAGFTLAGSVVNGTNGNNGDVDEGSVRFDGLTGVASITGSRFEGGFEDNFGIRNTSGTLNRVTFDGNTFGQNVAGNSSNDSLFIQSRGTATLNATLNNNDFDGAGADIFQFDAGVNSTSDLVATNNDFINNHPNTAAGGGGVTITTQESGDLTYNVSNNTFRGSKGTALGIAKVFGQPTNATLSGIVLNNTVGVSGVADSGSAEGSGIFVSLGGGGSHTNLIKGNQIRQYNNFGIYVFLGGTSQSTSGETHNGTMNTTIHANTIAESAAVEGVFNGIHLNSGTNDLDAYQVCLDIGSADPAALRNTLNGTGTGGGTDFRLRQRFATTVRLPGYTGTNTDMAAVVSYLQNRNNNPVSTTGSVITTTSSGGGGFVNTNPVGSACTQP